MAPAFDLLVLQQTGMSLAQVLAEAALRFGTPYDQMVRVIERYKEFKRRELPDPIHPYVIECAKVLSHFFLMGVGALVWYNQGIGDSSIVNYLGSLLTQWALAPASLLWGLPLLGGLISTVLAAIARYMLPPEGGGLDRPVAADRFTVRSALVRAVERYVSRPVHAGGAEAITQFTVRRRFAGSVRRSWSSGL